MDTLKSADVIIADFPGVTGIIVKSKIYAHFWFVKPKPSDCAVPQAFQFVQ